MGDTTTIRISRDTHARVTRLAAERHETIDETVSRAIRALRQDAIALDLAVELTDEETAWLDADAGDIVELDLGAPTGSEAGLRRPAVVVTAARVLRGGPTVVQVVPLTRTIRRSGTEVRIDPDAVNGLAHLSAAQCQLVRSVATTRIDERTGNVGPVVLAEVRDTLALLLDL